MSGRHEASRWPCWDDIENVVALQEQGRYLDRAAAASAGLNGNSPEEAFNYMGAFDIDGDALDGAAHRYRIRLSSPPPVSGFWSITMHRAPEGFMAANPIDRYSVGDRTAGLAVEPDGSMTVYLQHHSPGPELESNWLPAPPGPFTLALRIYWPD